MLKSKILKTVYAGVMSGLLVGVCNGQEVSAGESPLVKLNSVGVDYTSKYVWRGFELFGSKGAIQPSVDMSLLGDSGLGLNVWGSMPMGSGYEAFTELDYTLSYGTTVGEEETQLD
ncbi:MAG: hypothetical protein JXM68_06895, partial [Sedimentisphaerales bacterium]|nr:hypothetical protein [Sedimentisphaerales bacterium]